MMATWTTVHHTPEDGVKFQCNVCGQQIDVVVETTGTLECCGKRMHRVEANVN
jgi:desulfoferrodoxin-like iron-binding protein